MKKESLKEEYYRLMKELTDMNESLNEQQKEISDENPPSADFYASCALVEHKIKRIKEIEAQLQEK